MSSDATHSVYFDSHIRHVDFPRVSFTPFPSDHIYHEKRRSRPLLNPHFQNKLYLAASSLPTEDQQEKSAIEQSTNDPQINQPLFQIMKSIDSMEASINKKIESLHEMGVEGYASKKMNEAESHQDSNAVATPENSEALAGSVISTTEPKIKPAPKRKSKLLPIMAHEKKRKKNWYKIALWIVKPFSPS